MAREAGQTQASVVGSSTLERGTKKKKSERDVNKNKYEARNKERKQGREQEGEARGPGGRPPSLPLAAPPAPASADLIDRLVLPA